MVRIMFIVCLCMSMLACQKKIVKETVYVDKPTPVYVVPEPPVVTRPILKIDTLSIADKNDPGRLAQAIAASMIQLKGYIKELETVYNKYIEISKEGKQSLSTILPSQEAASPYTWDFASWKKYYDSLNLTTETNDAKPDSTK